MAILYKAVLDQADFRDAELYRAVLIGARGTGTIFTKANLRGATLSGADLTGARLDAADLHRATLHGANLASVSGLTQAQLDTACVDEQTKLPAELTRPAPCAEPKSKTKR
jgi:uncharacterized protein YjbI with pentapeptide repeats